MCGIKVFLSIQFFLQISQIEPGWFRGHSPNNHALIVSLVSFLQVQSSMVKLAIMNIIIAETDMCHELKMFTYPSKVLTG